jgi:hypothetical protein
MSRYQADSDTQEQRFHQAVAAYLEAMDAGETPDRQEWLARYPEFALQLTDFFAARDRVDQFAAPRRAENTDYLFYRQAAENVNSCLRAGREPDVEALIAPHPELAGQLRELVTALVTLHQLGARPEAKANAPPVAASPLPIFGQLGDFQIVREIGRGGMGVVYEAVQISLGRRVALKILPFAAALDPKQLQRFKNEAQAAAQLQHQHIVPVHYVGCERGVHFYAMQYIEGQTLTAVIHQLRLGERGWGGGGRPRGGAPTPPPPQ